MLVQLDEAGKGFRQSWLIEKIQQFIDKPELLLSMHESIGGCDYKHNRKSLDEAEKLISA